MKVSHFIILSRISGPNSTKLDTLKRGDCNQLNHEFIVVTFDIVNSLNYDAGMIFIVFSHVCLLLGTGANVTDVANRPVDLVIVFLYRMQSFIRCRLTFSSIIATKDRHVYKWDSNSEEENDPKQVSQYTLLYSLSVLQVESLARVKLNI